VHKQIAEYKP